MKVFYNSHASPDVYVPIRELMPGTAFDQVLATSDIITLHVPLAGAVCLGVGLAVHQYGSKAELRRDEGIDLALAERE